MTDFPNLKRKPILLPLPVESLPGEPIAVLFSDPDGISKGLRLASTPRLSPFGVLCCRWFGKHEKNDDNYQREIIYIQATKCRGVADLCNKSVSTETAEVAEVTLESVRVRSAYAASFGSVPLENSRLVVSYPDSSRW